MTQGQDGIRQIKKLDFARLHIFLGTVYTLRKNRKCKKSACYKLIDTFEMLSRVFNDTLLKRYHTFASNGILSFFFILK